MSSNHNPPNILFIVAHPQLDETAPEGSLANAALVKAVSDLPGLTVHDLYKHYPNSKIDIAREQKLLLEHDLFVFQFPLFWYSCPALLKQWMDVVLEEGFAFGKGGDKLKGKHLLISLTSGGPADAYQAGGRNHFTLSEFMRPFQQTAHLCGLKYHPIHSVMGVYRLTPADLTAAGTTLRTKLSHFTL
jgi:glutathione-regulated potassium-efflux system ancillary protein KefG